MKNNRINRVQIKKSMAKLGNYLSKSTVEELNKDQHIFKSIEFYVGSYGMSNYQLDTSFEGLNFIVQINESSFFTIVLASKDIDEPLINWGRSAGLAEYVDSYEK